MSELQDTLMILWVMFCTCVGTLTFLYVVDLFC